MSKRKRIRQIKSSEPTSQEIVTSALGQTTGKSTSLTFLKKHWWAVIVIALLSLGALGATLKYLEEDAQRELAKRGKSSPQAEQKQKWLNSVNPFLPVPSPSPTPQLAKEYIYAGSRLLAVEDTNASAAPPADLAVWRPSSGYWYVMGVGGSVQASQAWGTSSDKTVPGDYDGDGKTDFSVFRPSTGYWYITNSSDGATQGISFGQSGDITAPADYDGDGKTDAAVFRPNTSNNTGTWYIRQSSDSQVTYQTFGLDDDVPVATDFDGDGMADIAVWRNSDAKFYILRSTNSQAQIITFGQTNDEPLPADYDGDGISDAAVRRGNTWYILQSSSNSSVNYQWGNSTDTPVPNDYDADGKVDVAVWRGQSSNSSEIGDWYIRNSSTGQLRGEHWGIANDVPVPAFYRR